MNMNIKNTLGRPQKDARNLRLNPGGTGGPCCKVAENLVELASSVRCKVDIVSNVLGSS